MSFWKGRNLFKHIEIVPGGTFKGFGHVDPNGRVYYVNNITGASGAGGLSWNDAFAEVSQAITASEAYRKLGGLAPAVATNDYIRNTIVVQGTATAYAECTTFPHYCNVIGLGATAHGYGAGVARIGLDTHTTATYGGGIYGAHDATGDCDGSYFWNLAFYASCQKSAIKTRDILKTVFEDCAFMSSGNPVMPPNCGFEITGKASGLQLLKCLFGSHSGLGSEPLIGLNIHGTLFNNCEVKECHITGSGAAIFVVSGMNLGWHSVVRDCFIGEGSKECAIGIEDQAGTGTIHYINCFINAADPIAPGDDDTRYIGCVSSTDMVKT